jgi:VWFA-related protein
MTRLLACVTLACALVGISVGRAQPPQQQPTFRGGAETVRVYATVLDRAGRLVTSLSKEHFEIRDDGKPQPIVVFDNQPQPIQLVVLLDVSGSMAGNLPILRNGSRRLFAELGPDDVAKVGSFGRDIEISPEFTRDVAKLEAALPDHIPQSAPTPLWRAIDEAMGAFDEKSDRRRVVLVLSDGKDSDMRFGKRIVSQGEVIDRAREDDVMIYGVGIRSRRGGASIGIYGSAGAAISGDLPDPGLALTAEESGGGYTELLPRDDLGTAFTQIALELHSQYLLGYEPPKRDGKAHKIEVRVTERGLEPRARKSYVAPGSR